MCERCEVKKKKEKCDRQCDTHKTDSSQTLSQTVKEKKACWQKDLVRLLFERKSVCLKELKLCVFVLFSVCAVPDRCA